MQLPRRGPETLEVARDARDDAAGKGHVRKRLRRPGVHRGFVLYGVCRGFVFDRVEKRRFGPLHGLALGDGRRALGDGRRLDCGLLARFEEGRVGRNRVAVEKVAVEALQPRRFLVRLRVGAWVKVDREGDGSVLGPRARSRKSLRRRAAHDVLHELRVDSFDLLERRAELAELGGRGDDGGHGDGVDERFFENKLPDVAADVVLDVVERVRESGGRARREARRGPLEMVFGNGIRTGAAEDAQCAIVRRARHAVAAGSVDLDSKP
mmetsp:Transcript_14144/g.47197  ORF Transcript_14144/g.47197 Transcript_14144/m.47197 type:complete len:266 (+) Transcript_14144:3437-4234(+)